MTTGTVPYFNLVHQDNRMLKNDASIRKVPIHPNAEPFVSRLKMSKAKEPGRGWSEAFRINLGLPLGDGAHSLRHSFTSRMRLAGCDTSSLKRLLGHGYSERIERYGKYPLEHLYMEIQKLT